VGDPVIVETDSVGATRAALASPGDRPIIGWVDLTSPHLVDLLDELATGPGGHRLVAVRWSGATATLDDLTIQRGLATLADTALALYTTDPMTRLRLGERWPRLRLYP
jgi:L-fuconolactonase